jgi:hypothetical protein
MITITEKALRAINACRERAPQFEWCFHISWHSGEVETFRLPNGAMGWTRGIPKGWMVSVLPYVPKLDQRYALSVASGVKVLLDTKSPPNFEFHGGVVDADGDIVFLAP